MSSLNESNTTPAAPVPATGAANGIPGTPAHWRSLEQLADAPEFHAYADLTDKDYEELGEKALAEGDGVNRRRFLQVMGASMALAGLAGCQGKPDKVLPLTRGSADQIPGIPRYFNSAFELGGFATGVTVTSYDGRPIKIEGNPAHPMSRGRASVYAYGSTLELYDPDRSKVVTELNNTATWDGFVEYAGKLLARHKTERGAKLRVLSEASGSPSLADMRARLAKALPDSGWVEYEAVSRDNERLGAAIAFGKNDVVRTHLSLDKADVIVCLDADPLVSHPASLKYSGDFAAGRRAVGGKMSRVYAVESLYSSTGAVADHRLPLRSEQVGVFAAALAGAVAGRVDTAPGVSLPSISGGFLDDAGIHKFLTAVGNDLVGAQGKSVVIVGERQPPEVHALGHWLNAALGNVGKTVTYTAEPDAGRETHVDAIAGLAAEMKAGQVDTLIILGGNPAYNAPADLDFAGLLEKVPNSVHLGLYRDETAAKCRWHIPRTHYLEAWGDVRAWDGTVSILQPLIEPLYGGRSSVELLAAFLGEGPATGYEIVRRTFGGFSAAGSEFEPVWRKAVHDGIVAGTTETVDKTVRPAFKGNLSGISFDDRRRKGEDRTNPTRSGLEIVFIADSKMYDGRFANNAWLQELPEFLTKVTWDNVVLLAPATAAALGVENSTMVELRHRGRKLDIPAYVLPGHAPGSATVLLGYGRSVAGQVGGMVAGPADKRAFPVGFNTYLLRTSAAPDIGTGLEIVPSGRKFRLATTQDHHVIDKLGEKGRDERVPLLIRETDLADYVKDPYFAEKLDKHPPLKSLWPEYDYTDREFNPTGRRWGMTMDLSSCTGCNACVIACQAENNIPVMGKAEVLRGREMHWIRVDRYFTGDIHAPAIAHQPVTCQHCEMAPCEQVCPVAATLHDREGLNVMVYNRCIGTRYCSNNCPYKVRRFNWFNNHEKLKKPENEVAKLVFNPEVSVRSRGVMEKCTFCNHRIQAANITARNQGREIRDGEVVTACQQACPTGAIVFGNLDDSTSKVAATYLEPRRYALLAELNVKPRLQYLAKLRNPNPDLAVPKTAAAHGHGHG